MNSTVVNRAIRNVVRPRLRDQAFVDFTARSAWRRRDRLIDVINLQSFNSYNAGVLGCTTFSFVINLGIYLVDVPSDYPRPRREGQPRPQEYQCHVRRRVYPLHPVLPKARDVWAIDERGTNLESTVQAAALGLLDAAIPWFATFADPLTILRMLRDEVPAPDELTWLEGASDSAARNMAIGYIARALGNDAVAREYLQRALEQFRGFDVALATGRNPTPKIVPRHLEETVAEMDGDPS